MIDPKAQSDLQKFVIVAKKILYDQKHSEQLIGMMKTQDGAIHAVNVIIAAIEQRRKVPVQLAPLLAVSIFMLMLELFKLVFGKLPPDAAIKEITTKLMSGVATSHISYQHQQGSQQQSKEQPAPQQPAPQQPQGGIVQGAMA